MQAGDRDDAASPALSEFPDPSPTVVDSAPRLAALLPALICLSHLRWSFVYQRPQHLMSRCAKTRRVFFVEEWLPTRSATPWLEERQTAEGVTVLVPHLPESLDAGARDGAQRKLLDVSLAVNGVDDFLLWFYTPMSLSFTTHLRPRAIVYDCMDELSAFRGAPPEMLSREQQLLDRARIIFTGGRSLFEAKRHRHANVHAFPSAVDVAHFAKARDTLPDPADQAAIPHPRLGFFGVIDERFDVALLDAVAQRRADWQFVLIGPVVKIEAADLPQRPNIHYLGMKTYPELPAYLANWDVALMPFARNESTRYISPTKTPEYLAAGKPVVSTSITDVVAEYGASTIVRLADDPEDFERAIAAALADSRDPEGLVKAADAAIAGKSWDRTWQSMDALLAEVSA